jgi:hypothetical protein
MRLKTHRAMYLLYVHKHNIPLLLSHQHLTYWHINTLF